MGEADTIWTFIDGLVIKVNRYDHLQLGHDGEEPALGGLHETERVSTEKGVKARWANGGGDPGGRFRPVLLGGTTVKRSLHNADQPLDLREAMLCWSKKVGRSFPKSWASTATRPGGRLVLQAIAFPGTCRSATRPDPREGSRTIANGTCPASTPRPHQPFHLTQSHECGWAGEGDDSLWKRG